MRGYFDGDGSISVTKRTKQKQIHILGNYDFILKFQQILVDELKLSKTKIFKKENIYYLNYSGNINIRLIKDFFYNDFTICLERKRQIFLE